MICNHLVVVGGGDILRGWGHLGVVDCDVYVKDYVGYCADVTHLSSIYLVSVMDRTLQCYFFRLILYMFIDRTYLYS